MIETAKRVLKLQKSDWNFKKWLKLQWNDRNCKKND